MNILQRAGLGHLAERLAAVGDLPPLEPERFDLVEYRREQAGRYLERHPCRLEFGDAEVEHPKAAAWVRQVLADDPDRSRILLLVGNTGAGKSHLAWGVMRAIKLGRAEQGRGLPCWWVGHADLNAQTRPQPHDEHVAAFERYARAELLVLDDLSATRSTEWSEDVLHRLIEARRRPNLPTVVATNLSPVRVGEPPRSPLEQAVGDRVASRLLDATVVPLTGPDRRLAGARERARSGGAA